MLKKELLKGLEQPIIAFLARVPAGEGEETAAATVKATTFRDEGSEPIMANAMGSAFSPFTGKPMQAIKATAEIELDHTDFASDGDLAKICTCANTDCGMDIFTTREVATLINGEQFHCTVCREVNTASYEAQEIEAVASDDEEMSDEEIDELIEDKSEEDEDDADEGDGEASEDDEIEEVEEASAEETTVETPVEAAPAAAESEAVAADEEANEGEEATASVEDEQFEEVASLGTAVVVDLSAKMDIRPETMQIAPLNADMSRLAIFAYNQADDKNRVEHVGYLNRDGAATELAGLFSKDRLPALRTALMAAIVNQDNVEGFGFEAVTATILVDEEFENRLAEEKATVEVATGESTAEFVDNFKHSMNIAMAGMNKGVYHNPLIDEIAATLARFGIEDAELIATQTVERASNQYALAALDQTEQLLKLSAESREAVASTIEGQESVRRPTATKRSSNLEISTAHIEIPSTRVVAEDSPARPQVSQLFTFGSRRGG